MDGLNLYHGMRSADLLKYRWLDIQMLCEQLCQQVAVTTGRKTWLRRVTYCTSFVRDSRGQRRQDVFLQALAAHRPTLQILHGRYEEKGRDCECDCGCHNLVTFQKEKRTDVNLAVEMLKAAAAPDAPDALLLITGDTDLVPAIAASQETYGREVIVAAPPSRHQEHLNARSDHYLRVGRRHLKYSPLPSTLANASGYQLAPPDGWPDPTTW